VVDIYADYDDKKVERAIFEAIPGVLIITLDMKLGKAILKIFLVISPWQLRKNTVMSDLSWIEKLIIGEKITIYYVDIGLSWKAFSCSVCSTYFSSKSAWREPNVEQEPEPESQPIIDSFTAKVEADPGSSVIVEHDVLISQSQKLLLS